MEGMDVVTAIENTPTASGDRPKAAVTIVASGELEMEADKVVHAELPAKATKHRRPQQKRPGIHRRGRSSTVYLATMADSSDPLEVFIALLPHHRQYHGQLASDLDHILTSKQQALSSMQPTVPTARPRNSHNTTTTTTTTAPGFAKQVKRLVNQSMSTLTRWTKLLNATTASDIVPLQAPPNSQPALITPSPAKAEAVVNAGRNPAREIQSLSAAGSTKKAFSGVSRAVSNNIAAASPSLRPSTERAQHSGPRSGAGAGMAASGANTREGGASKKTQPAPLTNASDTADSEDLQDTVYRTDQPTYSHVAILVDISFLSVRALEVLENRVSTDLFEIEKARSNLITKIIALGMKKRALKELGILREQLIAGAMAVWDEPDLASRSQQLPSASKPRLYPTSTSLSAESLQRTYQDLFSFPFPNKVVSDLGASRSTQSPTSSPSGNIGPTQTFVLLVQALHNNAVRCWTDVRNGSLVHLLYPMLTRKDSPYNWCICIAKSQPKLAQQSLDALFRLLFISAGKAVENNPNRAYKEIFDFVQELSPIDYSSSHYQSWYTYMAHFASKVDDEATLAFVRSIDPDLVFNHLEEAVEALQKFQNFLPVWQNDTLPGFRTVTVSYQVFPVILAVRYLSLSNKAFDDSYVTKHRKNISSHGHLAQNRSEDT
ncbi:hypothetical protein BGZ90_012630 [Linnemannia elongata]|nr:hypothetical protein BGZ90_012630 [Linnemannia elongata]